MIEKDQGKDFASEVKRVDMSNLSIDPDIATIIPSYIALKYNVIPIQKMGDKLVLAMEDPLNVIAIDDVKMITGYEIETVVVSNDDIKKEIERFFGIEESVEKVMENIERDNIDVYSSVSKGDDVEVEGPIIKAVDYLVVRAINEKASDIHIDPNEYGLRVRFRVDGMLKDVTTPPKHVKNLLITRIKIMAGMDITNKRLPQDGRINYDVSGSNIDLRIATLPTIFGEKVVIRLLHKERVVFSLEELGFLQKNFINYKQFINKNSGMILVTGPTGCGKTTTLYSTINHLEAPEKNILTLEDPVEYQFKNINQVQIDEKTDLTFATGLRSVLRQDPDIIMVGEIRDVDTAQIAIRAALTGHLVFSTLHTKNVISTIFRFLDMEIPSYLLASALEGVLSQRLVRLICNNCREPYQPSKEEIEVLKKFSSDDKLNNLTRGKGCKYCNNTGYNGRTAVYELLKIDDNLQELLNKNTPYKDFKKEALKQGYTPLVKNAIKKVENGETTIEEVLKVAE
ncbi:GspE/PulE family protein [Natranaerofaba carboxydovora]|uniref:GspE/PulE family protein n=1 Tax=Natranaerofaba carboxydovora TaxID=2742683 RepID=UPI0030B84114